MKEDDAIKRLVDGLKEDKPPELITRAKAAHEIADALDIRNNEAASMLLYGLCATGDVRWVDGSGKIIDWDAVTVADFRDKPVYISADDVRDHLLRWSPDPQPKKRADAISKLIKKGLSPPRNIPWKRFCDLVRDACKGWGKAGKPAFGFSDKQIQRAVKALRPK
jgi:hypothetical protein